jgi:hypothetical protein
MRLPRSSPLATLAVAAATAAAIAGCGSESAQTSSGSSPSTHLRTTNGPAPVGGHHALRSSQPAETVRTFATSYARYLNGQLPSTALADATATAQKQAGPPVPARYRAGQLTVSHILPSSRRGIFIVAYRDHEHSYSAQLTVAPQRNRWRVTQLLGPDLDSLLRRTRAIPLTAGSGPAARAARQFLAGYLPWLYGHARATTIKAATPQLIGQLKAHPPRVPPTLQQVRPRVVALGTQPARGVWTALASITAGQQTYQLTVAVVRARGHWWATRVTSG